MEETTSYKWTVVKTKALIALRMEKDDLFCKKRNAAKEAWESIIKELDLGQHVSHKQASKKWENLKKKYKELKRPRTGTGTGQGEETPATWPFFMAMDEPIGARPSISPPVLVASALANPTIVFDPEAASCSSSLPPPPNVADDPDPSPPSSLSEAGTTQQPPPKKRKGAKGVLECLERKAEKEDERHRELMQQSEKFLTLLEKMVDKM
ncbi:hypothetical protein JOQ06_017853 [Pogonophryne albipinna]|uniref:Myb/SANT-like DNA-binding domain-containing protein n=1 Tax=Pogonophryne albipinna TaxID=1090488 RepID=A0AAD6AI65_9TELE|nr:hypothetical protein JOQ06_017853 [Pogonophryne albipinna]